MDAEIIEAHYDEVITIDLPHPPQLQQQQQHHQQHQHDQQQHQLTLNNISHNHVAIHHQQPSHTLQQHNPQQQQASYPFQSPTRINSTSQQQDQNLVDQRQQETLIPRNDNTDCNNDADAGPTVSKSDQNVNAKLESPSQDSKQQNNGSSKSQRRFKWSKEMSQVALRLVKHGYRPKIVSIAVGCSLRTAQKFAETVSPKIEGETFKSFEIKRRGRRSKDVNDRLEAIKEVLSKDVNKTQIEIAAELKVSNTTVCRDLKRIGTAWKRQQKDFDSPVENTSSSTILDSCKDMKPTSTKSSKGSNNKTPTKDKPKAKTSRTKRSAFEDNAGGDDA